MARRPTAPRRRSPASAGPRARRAAIGSGGNRDAVVPGSIPKETRPPSRSADDPHAHAVCRQCGRISDVELTTDELATLTALATQRPMDWSVETITFSLTGTCPRCRAAAPP